MIERKRQTLALVLVLVDAIVSCLALVAAYWLRFAVEVIPVTKGGQDIHVYTKILPLVARRRLLMATPREKEQALDRAARLYEDCPDHHTEFTKGVKRRSDSYHALKDIRKDPSYGGWRNAHFAPYVQHIVESTLASMVEDKLRFKIRARPTLEDVYDDTWGDPASKGERAHQMLMDWQIRQTKFTRIQRPFLLQNAIAQLTVAKTTSVEKVERRRRMVVVNEELTNDEGDVIVDPITLEPMTHLTLREETKAITVYDGPMTDVVDVHDFFWPKNALSLETANYVAHRIWLTKEELEERLPTTARTAPTRADGRRRRS